jgi:hypothetical protein
MAESDPKKIRPFGQSSDRRHLDSEEDPLVELARIVSEDSGFYASRAERSKPKREEAIDRNAYSADLESELLQELESSFSRSTAPRVAPAVPRQAPQAQPMTPPVDDSDDLLRSIERQLGDFERRTQATRSTAPTPVQSQSGWESRSEQGESEEYDPEPAASSSRRAEATSPTAGLRKRASASTASGRRRDNASRWPTETPGEAPALRKRPLPV